MDAPQTPADPDSPKPPPDGAPSGPPADPGGPRPVAEPAPRARAGADWRNWGDHPFVTLITALAGIVAIVSYFRRQPDSAGEPAPPPTCADIAGRWDWLSTGGVVAFTDDRVMHWYRVAADPLPLVSGTWVCQARDPLHFTLSWTETGLVDTLVLSADGQRLTGENLKNGFRLSATRQR